MVTTLSPKKQVETCCICLEDITIEKEAKLDACSHKYCHPCISKWVKEMENSCPQCKSKIHKIIYYDILGREQHEKVEDKVQEVDLFEDLYCQTCNERIYERDFEEENPTNNVAALCEDCLDHGVHVRCMTASDRELWQLDMIWMCQGC